MMTFKEFNRSIKTDVCPVCKTQDEGEVVLLGIVGTQEGNNMQAKQFHLKCLDLMYDKDVKIIYQRVG